MFSKRLAGDLYQRPQFGFAQVIHEGLGTKTSQDDSVTMKAQAPDLILQVGGQASVRAVWVGTISVWGFVVRNENDLRSQTFRPPVASIDRLDKLSPRSGIESTQNSQDRSFDGPYFCSTCTGNGRMLHPLNCLGGSENPCGLGSLESLGVCRCQSLKKPRRCVGNLCGCGQSPVRLQQGKV